MSVRSDVTNEAAGSEVVTTELEAVIYEREGPLARIILNQPETANAQSSAMVHDVEACLDDAEHDYDVRVVILKANGRGFCSGHLIGKEGNGLRGVPRGAGEGGLGLATAVRPVRLARVAPVGVPEAGDRAGPRLRHRRRDVLRPASRHHDRVRRRVLPDAAGPGARATGRRDHDRAVGLHELEARGRVPLHRADAVGAGSVRDGTREPCVPKADLESTVEAMARRSPGPR